LTPTLSLQGRGRRNEPPRQRRWPHQMWQDGPRDVNVASTGRAKLFMPTRGICQTPGIRASGALYLKPLPPAQPKPDKPAQPPIAIAPTVANRQEFVAV